MLSRLRVFARAILPPALRRQIRALQLLLLTDRESIRSYKALERADPPSGTFELRVRALGGKAIRVRVGTTDVQVVRDTFLAKYHLPPRELGSDLDLIWDLGSNIGTTIAHMCHLFPDARVVGVELDPENARLCRLNIEPWKDRCEVIEAAVWSHDGVVEYGGEEWGAAVARGGKKVARALMLNSLVPPSGSVDYVKMDIEGAEAEVLRVNTEWAECVRAIKVEVHGEYGVAACLHDLEKLGFSARRDRRHHACAVGLR